MRKQIEAEKGFPAFLTLSWAWQESLEDPASVKAALARNLRHHRESRGLSHKSLAQAAQVPLAAIRDIEAGRGLPDIATILRLAESLRIEGSTLADPRSAMPAAPAQHKHDALTPFGAKAIA